MNRFVRRGSIGAFAGAAAGALPFFLGTTGVPEFVVAIVAGSTYAACLPPSRDAYPDSMMAGASLGIPLWGITSVILLPLLSGDHMAWDAVGMRAHFAPLVGWVLFGALFGCLRQSFSKIAERLYGPEATAPSPGPINLPRIVILGGGFGGMKIAESLEEQLGSSASICLVSDTNALLFTPMLAEVAGSSLEPSHISVPLRTSLRQTHFVRGRVTAVDFARRGIVLDGDGAESRELPYDHVIFALGEYPITLGWQMLKGWPSTSRHCWTRSVLEIT